MHSLIQSLKARMLESTELLKQIACEDLRRVNRSLVTEHDYLRLGQSLLIRSKFADSGLIGVVSNTRRPTTFQKRMAALRFTLQQWQLDLLRGIVEPISDEQVKIHILAFEEQIECVQAMIELRHRGFVGERAPRNSKRRALSGLPADWRVQLCERGRAGRYADAMLVAALTGCRPGELERGVKVWKTQDAATQETVVQFDVVGAKVKSNQGQPLRRLTYGTNTPHPLLSMFLGLLQSEVDKSKIIRVESGMNFSAEVRRLAASLWPAHRHAVTAYCFRHQWGADAKRNGDTETVSRGLGHLSLKTQRIYGTTSQGKAAHSLKPLRVEATRVVNRPSQDVSRALFYELESARNPGRQE